MICNNCKTPFDLVTIDTGKSKFCRSCGSVLYKNINGNIVFDAGVPTINNQFNLQKNQDTDAERLRQEMILKQHQLEIEQQKQVEADRIKQEQLILKRQAEIEQEKIQQAEKLRQEQLIKERQLELQRQKEAEELRLADIEKQRQLEIEKQQAIEFAKQQQIRLEQQIEQERLEKEQQEKAFIERELQRQKEYELELQREKERILAEQQRKDKESEDTQKEKEDELQRFREKELEDQANNQKSNWWKYLLVAIIALVLGAGGYFTIDRFVLNKEVSTNEPSEVIKNDIAASLTSEKITTDLIDKEIIGWGRVEANDIKAILTEKQARNDSIICTSTLSLSKNNITSKAEVTIPYIDTVATNVITNKITYQNTAPTVSWFNFTPVQNCDIYINTNNNPIQLKTCENCTVLKLNTNNETLYKLVINPASIFISSDNKFDAIVDFIYIPKKIIK